MCRQGCDWIQGHRVIWVLWGNTESYLGDLFMMEVWDGYPNSQAIECLVIFLLVPYRWAKNMMHIV